VRRASHQLCIRHGAPLKLPVSPSRGEFGKALRDSVLELNVVGIQVHGLTRDRFEFRREIDEECLGRGMYRPGRLDTAAPRPFRRMTEEAS